MGLFSLFSKKAQEPGDDHNMPVKPRRGRAAKAQDDEPLDPMLPEKKRARRRLIGAVALVLAAIIGLPMIFDSEPKPLSDDIDIQIPSREKSDSATSRPMPLPLPPESLPADTRPDAASGQPVAKAAPEAKPVADTPVASNAKPAVQPQRATEAKGPTDKAAVSAVAPGAAADPKPSAVPKPEPAKLAKTDAPKHASSAQATDKLAETIAEKTRGRFVVQVAAVSSAAKAEELQNRLKKAGIQSFSQKVSTKDGERFRIRIGPFGTREEADRFRSRLGPLGLSGTVQSV